MSVAAANEDETSYPDLRRVTIMTLGSRGDIQPFVAIGIALKRAGYAVRVMTSPSETHAALLGDFGLEHVPLGVDVDRFMRVDGEARRSMETGDTLRFFKRIASVVDEGTSDLCRPFHDEFVANGGARRPDLLLVSYLNRYFGMYARHVLGIPTIEIRLQYWAFDDPTRAPMGMPTLPLGLHRLIQTKLMVPQDYKTFRKLDRCLADITTSREGATSGSETPSLDDFLLYDQLLESEVNQSPLLPTLVCQPPVFKNILHPTLRSSRNVRFVGPAIVETADQLGQDARSFGSDAEREKIQEFLTSNVDRKPVYMGWGSMIRKSTSEMAVFAVEALMIANRRGIVLGGSAGLGIGTLKDACAGRDLLEYANENVLFVERAPHEWLFPRVSLTVHHGGAGTLNAALRAGVPTIVTPVFGDQYDNSFVVQNLGVGIGFDRQLQKIDASDLAAAIHAVANDPDVAARAEKIGETMRNECGCRAVVEEVGRHWREDVKRGRFSADINDWKLATRETKLIAERKNLLSRVALGLTLAVASIAFLIQ